MQANNAAYLEALGEVLRHPKCDAYGETSTFLQVLTTDGGLVRVYHRDPVAALGLMLKVLQQ